MADWEVAPRLLAIPGVAQVHTIGGELKEYQILADQNKMNFAGVSINELITACKEMNINTSGGFINEYGNKYIVRGMARTNHIKDIENSLVKTSNGIPVRIKEIADVVIGKTPPIGTGSYRGEEAVLITVTRQPDANSVKLSGKIKKVIDDIASSAGHGIIFHTDIYDQASFISPQSTMF